jgi:hypothetical protein
VTAQIALPADKDLAAVVRGFVDYWSDPAPNRFGSFAWAPDVHLVAPFLEQTIGVTEGYQEMARMLSVFDSVVGEVHRWATTPDAVLIEWTMRARVGRRHLEVPFMDRITVRDGLIVERVAFMREFDLFRHVVVSPRAAVRAWRAGLAPFRWQRRLSRAMTSRRRFLPPSDLSAPAGGNTGEGPTAIRGRDRAVRRRGGSS